jgi:hypothetical protein
MFLAWGMNFSFRRITDRQFSFISMPSKTNNA